MISSKAKFSFVLIPMFLLYPFFSFGQGPGNGAPFRMGEVVVGGPPSDLPPGTTVVKYLPHANLTVVGVETGKEWGMVQKYRLKGKLAGLNYIAKASDYPNDPSYSFQWNFRHIQSEEAWSITHGEGVTVAVLDTGLAPGGSDGIGCVSQGYNTVNDNNYPLDGHGHGTHVSGTIAQNTNNGFGVAGLAYKSCIMPVKVLDDSGSGTFADIAEGIYFAVNGPDNDANTDDGAHVINMSLGTNARYGITSDPIMDPALAYAREKGVTVVCAAGNDRWAKNVSYPATNVNTIAVGATGPSDTRASYSNYGLGLDIMAPGGDMTVDLDGNGYGDGILQETIDGKGGFGNFLYQGTSMAAPHVSAVAALIISTASGNQTVDPASVYEKITSTALDLGLVGFDSQTAYGLVQAAAAVNYAPCTDCDGDKYDVGLDCNDNNPSVNPGASEVCNDTIDNNCDGIVNENCAPPACTEKKGYCDEGSDCCSGNCLLIKNICL